MRALAEENGLGEDMTMEFLSVECAAYGKYLRLAIRSVEREYGSMDAYLRERLGLSNAEKAALQAKFLTD